MREKSEMQATLSAKVCRIEPLSLTVESEPENVLNTAYPGRSPSWILPAELTTPAKPTTGIQSPSSPPVAYGPSSITQHYRPAHYLSVLPAQWGDRKQGGEGDKIDFMAPWR